jgi:ATPase subunit of ABC transporter with duplicated ATPase domains
MLISATDLSLRLGERVLLEDISLRIESKSRIALIGPNGTGKSTLLRLLLGQSSPDAGEIWRKPGLHCVALPQKPSFAPGQRVQTVLEAALGRVSQLETTLRSLEHDLADPIKAHSYEEVLLQFERLAGYSAQARLGRVMKALALTNLAEQEATTLSGGEQTRLALAAALIEQPELLLLDEPTNHLDIAMREWLEGYLQEYNGAMVLVSHDRQVLDAVAKATWRLFAGKLEHYRGAWSQTQAALATAQQRQHKQHQQSLAVAKDLTAAVGRTLRHGKGHSTVVRRAQVIERRAAQAEAAVVEAPWHQRRLALALAAGAGRRALVLEAKGLNKGFGSNTIIREASLRLRLGERVALLAPNGAGKTTLLRLLTGELWSDVVDNTPGQERGVVQFGAGVQLAYLDQQHHGLRPGQGLLAQLSERVGETRAKAVLGQAGFRPVGAAGTDGQAGDWTRPVDTLSGGEAARAGLALVGLLHADVLLLDEPTNHLDVEVLETLEQALLAYPGAVLFVTHDRAFAARLATRVLGMIDGVLREFAGGFTGYERFRRGQAELLDPARLFEGEVAEPEPAAPAVMTLEQAEIRSLEIEDILLHEKLTTREAERLYSEREWVKQYRYAVYSHDYRAPIEYSHQVREGNLLVQADVLDGAWVFWAKDTGGVSECPVLIAKVQAVIAQPNNRPRSAAVQFWRALGLAAGGDQALADALVVQLDWQNSLIEADNWFRQNLLLGTTRILLEHLEVTRVLWPIDMSLPKHWPIGGMTARGWWRWISRG